MTLGQATQSHPDAQPGLERKRWKGPDASPPVKIVKRTAGNHWDYLINEVYEYLTHVSCVAAHDPAAVCDGRTDTEGVVQVKHAITTIALIHLIYCYS